VFEDLFAVKSSYFLFFVNRLCHSHATAITSRFLGEIAGCRKTHISGARQWHAFDKLREI
jgi:hypothetical protein